MFNRKLSNELVILDRDGIINYDSLEYVKSPQEWVAIEGSLEAIARLNNAGIKVAVATNQSGVARGYYSHQTLGEIHDKLQRELKQVGGWIDKIVYCPHLPNTGCVCRKPSPGMLYEIAEYFDVAIDTVPYIGDRVTDVQCALTAGALPILISSSMTEAMSDELRCSALAFKSLSDAVDAILHSLATD